MQLLVAAFWGAFFGTAALMLAGALTAYLAELRRVAWIAASATVTVCLFALSYLGLVPLESEAARVRLDANVFALCAALLGHLVLAMIGHMREPAAARRWRTVLYGSALSVAAIGWLLPAWQAFALSTLEGFTIGAIGLVLCIDRARHGDRLAGLAIAGVVSVVGAATGLTWIVVQGDAPWPVHALSAVGGMAYLSVIAVVLWQRFSYLIELREVMLHGAAYDPITRMRTHSETGQMVGIAFFEQMHEGKLAGVVAVSIGNLLAIEKLHGRAAVNHGLFVSAGRLRRALQGGVEAGRLGEDGFLVLVRDVDDVAMLAELGHEIVRRLSRPVALSTSPGELEAGQANWVAQVGVGIVVAAADERPSAAIARARAMSRAALGFPSRVAWEDDSGHVAEAPLAASA
ncbi:diguanylate cyclase domain-containing protein [Ramlibacter sp. PS4R-6]|uniref:diguanylate cyclase domain-containing protein n=1 Tax=Ramlibacter sp. PS4R-6 TaxID=3133438 RepID=UPI0030960AF6